MLFLFHYSSSTWYLHNPLIFFNLKQKSQESLWEYIQWFTHVVLEILSVALEIRMGAFMQGLNEGDFFHSLVKKSLKEYDELLTQVKKYINIEEA